MNAPSCLIFALFILATTVGLSDDDIAKQGLPVDHSVSEIKQLGLGYLIDDLSIYALLILNGDIERASKIVDTSHEWSRKLEQSAAIKQVVPTGQDPAISRLEIVGVEIYSSRLISVVFLKATEFGPLCLRLNIAIPEDEPVLNSFDATSNWDEMDAIVKSVTRLKTSIKVDFNLEKMERILPGTKKRISKASAP